MQPYALDYRILGNDLQAVEIILEPGQTVISEAGALLYMDSGITFDTKMSDGAKENEGFFAKFGRSINRAFSGEGLFLTHFTNEGATLGKIAFGAPIPGKILPIDMSKKNTNLICQSGAFLACEKGNSVDLATVKKLRTGFFGGEGFILQRIAGNGLSFLQAGGTIIEKELNNEKIILDTGCIVAFDESIEYSIQASGSFKSMLFGGEGIFLTTLEGTGKVYIQTLPFNELANRVIDLIPKDHRGGNNS